MRWTLGRWRYTHGLYTSKYTALEYTAAARCRISKLLLLLLLLLLCCSVLLWLLLLCSCCGQPCCRLLRSWDGGGGTAVYSAVAAAVCLLLLVITEVRECCVCVHFVRINHLLYGLDTGTRHIGKVPYDLDTGTRHLGEFGTTLILAPDGSVSSVHPPKIPRVPSLHRNTGDTGTFSVRPQYPTEHSAMVRYEPYTGARHFGKFGATLLPIPTLPYVRYAHQPPPGYFILRSIPLGIYLVCTYIDSGLLSAPIRVCQRPATSIHILL